jgi:NodT family efflux transporter outer membrane factor (OMF) lipoprotein
MQRLWMTLFAVTLLSGCAPLASLWNEEASPAAASAPLSSENMWWSSFNDPLMDALAPQLLAQNLDLKIAATRVAEARGISRTAQSGLLPQISLSANAARSNEQVFVNKPLTTKQAGFDASWELDVFGRIAAGAEAADSRVTSQAANAEDVRNTVLAELFRAVVEWRQAQQTIAKTKALLASQQQQISLFEARVAAGLIEQSSLERARAQRAQTAVQLPLAEAAARTAQYQMERLLGREPESLTAELAAQPPAAIHIPTLAREAALPIERIKQRPDLRASYAEMIAAQADLKQAEAELWPRLTLTGFFGIRDLPSGIAGVDNPIWSLASGLTAPLLNFGRLRGAVDAASARSQRASLAYEDAVLKALQETRTALSDYLSGLAAVAQQEGALKHRRDAVALAKERFTRGLTDMTDLTTAQTELDEATLTLIERQANAAIAYIRLQKALGTSVRAAE